MATAKTDSASLSFEHKRLALLSALVVALGLGVLAFLDHGRAERDLDQWRTKLCGTLPEPVSLGVNALRADELGVPLATREAIALLEHSGGPGADTVQVRFVYRAGAGFREARSWTDKAIVVADDSEETQARDGDCIVALRHGRMRGVRKLKNADGVSVTIHVQATRR